MKVIKYNSKTLDFELPKDFLKGNKIKGSKAKYWFNQYNILLDEKAEIERKHILLKEKYADIEQKYKELLNAT